MTREELPPAFVAAEALCGKAKAFRLERGAQLLAFAAEVAPVHERKPMRFFTPTAEAEVLGTQFTLRADSSSTRLIVYEGSVRATRLADGSRGCRRMNMA